jgi:lipopolysaccharide transport system ATP-binding protein
VAQEPIITVEGLSKSFLIGHRSAARAQGPYATLRESIGRGFRNAGRKSLDLVSGRQVVQGDNVEEFWALTDIDFDVRCGEVLGIIGRNGAGKSTLLKILSRIIEPTKGKVTLRGRASSLLEVGTGFHPELSGRENIFLNGAILGMTRREIRQKFDEIVAFAEVEKFIDTPVKRYSSGMAVRLAFSIAAHLDPDILIVDEVLAVGDAAFQKKCVGKMQDATRDNGRTVLFVSHNMGAMLALCPTGILLEKGRIAARGDMQTVARRYLASMTDAGRSDLGHRIDRSGDGAMRVTSLDIQSADADGFIRSTSRLKVTLGYRSSGDLRNPHFMVGIYDYANTCIYFLSSESFGLTLPHAGSSGEVVCITAPINLTPGACYANVAIFSGATCHDHLVRAADFEVQPGDNPLNPNIYKRSDVLVLLDQQWSVRNPAGP